MNVLQTVNLSNRSVDRRMLTGWNTSIYGLHTVSLAMITQETGSGGKLINNEDLL